MTRNLPSLKEIAGNPAELRELSLDALDALLGECTDQVTVAGAAKKAITARLEATYAAAISGAYSAKGADFGSVHVSDAGFDILIDTPKKVEWDQTKLRGIRAAIADSGDNPAEYLKETLAVDERAYSAWPAHIRATFEDARTVKPGTRTVKLVRKEAA